MKTRTRRFAAALAFLILGPAVAAAQKLDAGLWTGTVTPPGEPAVAVTYDVKIAGDTISITLNAAEHGSFPFSEIKIANGKLTFSWVAGPTPLKCELKPREDAAWAGTCADPDGATGEMVMVPPKKG
ncbi:MAG: hypothetical protein WEE89_15515 [Gemmatimonadota bacterium]